MSRMQAIANEQLCVLIGESFAKPQHAAKTLADRQVQGRSPSKPRDFKGPFRRRTIPGCLELKTKKPNGFDSVRREKRWFWGVPVEPALAHPDFFWSGGCGAAIFSIDDFWPTVVFEAAFDGG